MNDRHALTFTTTLHEIHAALGGELLGDPALAIHRIAAIGQADAHAISFIANPRYRSQLESTAAGCVIVAPALAEAAAQRGAVIVASDPYHHYARLTQWWATRLRAKARTGVHASAVIGDGVKLGEGVTVGPLAVIEAGAEIGDGAVIGAQSFVGPGVVIGERTRLAPHVTLMHGTTIGARGIVHAGVVVGADGFGFAPHQGRWDKIEQLGGVRIGDDVEIGANTCIDRGALGDTVIGDGVKLDNLIQVGHNVHIGDHSAMAGCVGIAGSAKIGRGCTVGGGAIVLGHLELADGVHISAASVVMRSITRPGQYSGVFPIDDNASWEKNAATLRQLHTLRDRLRSLEKKIDTP